MRASNAEFPPGAILDITAPLHRGMAVWPGDPLVEFEAWPLASGSAHARVTRVCFGSHTGSHVDAPVHVLPVGATVDQLALAAMIGPCCVVETDAWPSISELALKSLGIPPGTARLLIRTRASRTWPNEATLATTGCAGLTLDAADWLVARGVALVGIDCPSIEAAPQGAEHAGGGLAVHRSLLGAGIIVLEGLWMQAAKPGEYLLICLPLKLEGCDGAPVRAILAAELMAPPARRPRRRNLVTDFRSSDGGKHVD